MCTLDGPQVHGPPAIPSQELGARSQVWPGTAALASGQYLPPTSGEQSRTTATVLRVSWTTCQGVLSRQQKGN